MSREAFEAWHGGIYRGHQADIAWAAWQAALAQPQAEPAMWQQRWTNPGNNPNVSPEALEWESLELKGRTDAETLRALVAYRFDGRPCYEVRALYATPQQAQPQAQPAPVPAGWVSVADQMPEKGIPVLALDEIGKYPIRACWIAKFTQEAGCDFEGDTDYCEANDECYWPEGWYEWNRHEGTHWFAPGITHWMPCPPPPGSAPAAPAVPAVQPLSGDVLYALWASENGLEDCKLCKLNDFTKAARFFEQAHGIAAPGGKP